jgi:hypothetical protein
MPARERPPLSVAEKGFVLSCQAAIRYVILGEEQRAAAALSDLSTAQLERLHASARRLARSAEESLRGRGVVADGAAGRRGVE